jgi:hypothetical protein
LAPERASIVQALGHFDQAFMLGRATAERRTDFDTLAALAVLHAERGETAAAEGLFAECRARYRGVSPIPIA